MILILLLLLINKQKRELNQNTLYWLGGHLLATLLVTLGADAAGLLGLEDDVTEGFGADDVVVVAGLLKDDVAVVEAGLAAAPKVGLVAVEEEGEAGFTVEARGFAVDLESADLGEDEVVLDWVKTDGMFTEEGLLEVAAGLDGAADDVAVVAAGLVTDDVAVVAAGLLNDDVAEVVGLEATEVVVDAAGLLNEVVVVVAGLELYSFRR